MNRLSPRPARLFALFAIAAFTVAACGENPSDEPSTLEESTEEPAIGSTEQDDAESVEAGADDAPAEEAESEGSATSAPEVDVTEPEAGVDSEELLAALEAEVVPPGDVLGVERPGSGKPSTTRLDTYRRLCPAEDVAVNAIWQSDPLIENIPVERFFVVFDTPEEATAFAETLAGTEVGCETIRENEVAVSTFTVTSVEPLDVGAGSVQLTAALSLDMVNFDNDPPDRDILRSVGHHDRTVVVVASLASYATFVETDVHEPLLADGLDIVTALN